MANRGILDLDMQKCFNTGRESLGTQSETEYFKDFWSVSKRLVLV